MANALGNNELMQFLAQIWTFVLNPDTSVAPCPVEPVVEAGHLALHIHHPDFKTDNTPIDRASLYDRLYALWNQNYPYYMNSWLDSEQCYPTLLEVTDPNDLMIDLTGPHLHLTLTAIGRDFGIDYASTQLFQPVIVAINAGIYRDAGSTEGLETLTPAEVAEFFRLDQLYNSLLFFPNGTAPSAELLPVYEDGLLGIHLHSPSIPALGAFQTDYDLDLTVDCKWGGELPGCAPLDPASPHVHITIDVGNSYLLNTAFFAGLMKR